MIVTPQGKSIQALYRDYKDGNLYVNRLYQRKLVWSIEEKQCLIDSILNGYPIPLILLAERDINEGYGKYEILDGIQRFNAVFTFIENYFDYNGKFFDVNEFSRARQIADEGGFKVKQDVPKLLPKECANFLDYQFALTIYPTSDQRKITAVFGRINSSGRQLSAQEQRQAGVVSDFSQIVRSLSSEIRGDVSKDILLLNEMPAISVDSSSESHGYGIKADDTLWCKQGIMSVKQIKESEDEQMIADILASVLLEKPIPASKELLNDLYDSSKDLNKEIEKRLSVYSSDKLVFEIKSTFSIIIDLIEKCSKEPNYLRKIVRPGSFYPIKAPFYAIFMAFFDLIVKQHKSPDQPSSIIKSLENLDSKLDKGAHYETEENRTSNINLTKGLIQDYFVNKIPPILGHGESLAIDFENSLRRSRIETPRYEFKQGILRLDNNRDIDNELLIRLTQTACGISNLGPDAEGYIFLGVADREEHADRIKSLDKVTKKKLADQYLVGIEREAKILNVSIENYLRKIVSVFQQADITEPLKTQLLSSFDIITLHELTFIRIRIPKQKEVSFVGGKAYYRQNSNTIAIEGQQLLAISKLF